MHVSEEMHSGFLKRSVLQEGDILVSIAGTLGKTAIMRKYDLPMNTNQAVSFIRLKCEEISRKYVKLAIDTPIIQSHLLSQTKVTAIPNLTLEIIGSCPIPLAPLAEQQRIVDRIESLFTKLDEAKEKAQAVVDGFEDRKAAILHKAFTGELTAEWRAKREMALSSWEKKIIADFAEVKGGKRLPKGWSLTTEKTDHPYLRIADFGDDTIDQSDIHYITDDIYQQISRYIIENGDVYISIVGTIGKCGTVPEELSGANLTENAARIITRTTLPRYLVGFLSSPKAQEDIKGRIRSATLGKLSLTNINNIVVPIPAKEEQQEIITILDKLLKMEIKAKETAEQVIDQIDTMKKSILARAFRGELGTNDPNDESAVELLKRVLKEDVCVHEFIKKNNL